MPRARNTIETVQLTISVSERVKEALETLTSTGLYGKNAADTANELLKSTIRELVKTKELVLPDEE